MSTSPDVLHGISQSLTPLAASIYTAEGRIERAANNAGAAGAMALALQNLGQIERAVVWNMERQAWRVRTDKLIAKYGSATNKFFLSMLAHGLETSAFRDAYVDPRPYRR